MYIGAMAMYKPRQRYPDECGGYPNRGTETCPPFKYLELGPALVTRRPQDLKFAWKKDLDIA